MRLTGRNLPADTLHELLARPRLLVFLRHSGCVFCRQTIAELRNVASELPPVVFFHQGTVEQGDALFGELWPEATAVADPSRELYRAFDLGRGSFSQMLSFKVLKRGLEAARQGYSVGTPVGDIWTMPGMFLADRRGILWSWSYQHAGDHPPFGSLAELLPCRTPDCLAV